MKNRKSTAVFFATIMLFISCGKDYTTQVSVFDDVSSEEIFKSIFFMNGPLSDKIPSISSKKEIIDNFKVDLDAQQEIIDAENQIVGIINEMNPQFLEEFREAIINDSPYEIEEKIIEGAELLIQATQKMGFANFLEDGEIKNILLNEGIDIDNYDLENPSDIANFYEDISEIDLTVLSTIKSKSSDSVLYSYSEQKGQCFVAAVIAVAAVFLAVGILAAVRVAGVVLDAYFVVNYIEVEQIYKGDAGSFENNLLVRDIILLD